MADKAYYKDLLRKSVSALRPLLELDDKTANKLEKLRLKIERVTPDQATMAEAEKEKLAGQYVQMLRTHENMLGAGLTRAMNKVAIGLRRSVSRTKYDYGILRPKIVLETNGDKNAAISDLGSELGHAIVDMTRRHKDTHPGIDEAYDIACNEVLTRAMGTKSGIKHAAEKAAFAEEYLKKRSTGAYKNGMRIVKDIVNDNKFTGGQIQYGVSDSVACGMNGIPSHCIGFYIVRELKKTLGDGYARAMFGYLREPKANMSDSQKFIDGVKAFGLASSQSSSGRAGPDFVQHES